MSQARVLIAFGQGLFTLFTYAQALLIESSLLPQVWLWFPLSSDKARLLRPTYTPLALYALSESCYYLFWTWLFKRLDVSEEPSLGAMIGAVAHTPMLAMFAQPDDLDCPTPSPWKNQIFRHIVNAFLIQASAAQNAAWLLMLDASDIDAKLQGLHVIFGSMAMFMTMMIWVFCWWGLVDQRTSAREMCNSLRRDASLRQQLLGQAVWLVLLRMSCRWMLGLRLFTLAP